MINVLIVEYDCNQRKNLRNILKELNEELNVYEADNDEDALKIANNIDINCFFMDIVIKDSNGLNLAIEIRKMSKYKLTWMIFITTVDDYMLKAFKQVHCYDYILKPYKKEKIQKIMSVLIENHYKIMNKKKNFIVVESKGELVKIYVDDIFFVEINDRISSIHTKMGLYKISRLPLKKIVDLIKEDYIIQTHKSFIVNVKYIRKLGKISKTCWEIDFYGYNKIAFLTKTYKDNIRKILRLD